MDSSRRRPLLYARTGAENNQVYPSANLLGSFEGVKSFFFVEGAVNVSQQYFTPFGAQPQGLANATQNRYTIGVPTASRRISRAPRPDNIKYELRNNNIWTNLSGTPIDTNNAYTDEWKGKVSSPMAPFGWALDYDWTDVKFTDQRPTTTQLARGTLLYQDDPQFRFDVDGGYEDNQYPFSDYRGAIYGAGLRWEPDQRTNIVGNWEHRFFGSSYLFTLDHRTPLSCRCCARLPQYDELSPAISVVACHGKRALAARFPVCSRVFPTPRSALTRSIRSSRTGACRTR